MISYSGGWIYTSKPPDGKGQDKCLRTLDRPVCLQVIGRQARIRGSLPFASFGGERALCFIIPLPPYDFFILRRL